MKYFLPFRDSAYGMLYRGFADPGGQSMFIFGRERGALKPYDKSLQM
jgi:hypothetical protein